LFALYLLPTVDFFFFSSRRRHTRSKRDWSSDVCSSDLSIPPVAEAAKAATEKLYGTAPRRSYFAGCSNGGRQAMAVTQRFPRLRSEERRVGKERRVGWTALQYEKEKEEAS